MRRRGAIRLPHGRQTQDSCIGFIEEYKYFRDTEISDRAVCKICHEKYPAVPTRTIRNWLKRFNPYGECCPWETRIHKTRLSKVMRGFRTADDDVKNRVVLEIFEENPEYFLDELVREFGIRTGRKIGTSSVRRILVNNGVKGIAEGLPSKDGSKTRSIIH
jgi:hypothetical protein